MLVVALLPIFLCPVRLPPAYDITPEKISCPKGTKATMDTGSRHKWCERSDGTKHGPWKAWHRDGQQSEAGAYADGERDGPWTEWAFNGTKTLEGQYTAGLEHGVWRQWSHDGDLLGQYTMKRGTGTHQRWHNRGKLAKLAEYVEGKLDGRWIEYGYDGDPRVMGHYVAGVRHGNWWRWEDETGKTPQDTVAQYRVTRVVRYRDGKVQPGIGATVRKLVQELPAHRQPAKNQPAPRLI